MSINDRVRTTKACGNSAMANCVLPALDNFPLSEFDKIKRETGDTNIEILERLLFDADTSPLGLRKLFPGKFDSERIGITGAKGDLDPAGVHTTDARDLARAWDDADHAIEKVVRGGGLRKASVKKFFAMRQVGASNWLIFDRLLNNADISPSALRSTFAGCGRLLVLRRRQGFECRRCGSEARTGAHRRRHLDRGGKPPRLDRAHEAARRPGRADEEPAARTRLIDTGAWSWLSETHR